MVTKDGSDLPVEAPTICLHGDAPNALEVVRAVKERLEGEGIRVTPLSKILQ